ncbi:hypothetical protein N0V93_000776 [Gnomoniopsis smithogilvyi]|uniref:Zinc finger PHD-type domain-containing protein n=1 Tax=Gnomoniopsis smithogilvyi TaxID=1191159 RepID=A0A9W8Z2A2_9PEZI|nr:hypothetical protein N0V93_000776 [Gnomoniopsis smithogilvyi]
MAAQSPSQLPSPSHAQLQRPRLNPSSFTGSRCAICSRPKQVDKILVACTRCTRHYHPSCHRPLPKDPFTCARCHDRVQRKQTLKRYDGIKSKSRAQNSSSTKTTSISASVATSVRDPIADMFSSAEGISNPFLTEDSDYWARTSSSKCRIPNCNNDADQNHLTCEDHSKIISPKSIKGADRPHVSRHDSLQINGSRHPPDASSPSSRKTLEAKTTARKTVSRRPFYPAESRQNQNGHSSSIPNPQKPVNQSSLDEISARKKQRLISPSSEEPASRNITNSCSPLALPSGFHYPKPNGDILRTSRLASLSNDLHAYSPRPELGQDRSRAILSSYGDYLSSPIFSHPAVGPDIIKPNIESIRGHGLITGEDADVSSRDISRNASLDTRLSLDRSVFPPDPVEPLVSNEPLRRNNSLDVAMSEDEVQGRIRLQKNTTNPMILKPASTRSTPTKVKASQIDIINAPPSHLKSSFITSTSVPEKQRQQLVEERKDSILDQYIYGQASSSAPPPDVKIERRSAPELIPQAKGVFIHLDPRKHRIRPHSEQWYRQKEEEIKARGGRKANFGKAAQRIKEQRLKEDPEEFEAILPDRVRNNEDWLAATRWFQGRAVEVNAAQPQTAALATPVRTKRKYTRRQPVAPPQPVLDKKATRPGAA